MAEAVLVGVGLVILAGLVGVWAGVQVAAEVDPAAVGWAIAAGSVILGVVGVAVLAYIGWRISEGAR